MIRYPKKKAYIKPAFFVLTDTDAMSKLAVYAYILNWRGQWPPKFLGEN
jgi:hypothetical protein